jgi:hypothetical protein
MPADHKGIAFEPTIVNRPKVRLGFFSPLAAHFKVDPPMNQLYRDILPSDHSIGIALPFSVRIGFWTKHPGNGDYVQRRR